MNNSDLVLSCIQARGNQTLQLFWSQVWTELLQYPILFSVVSHVCRSTLVKPFPHRTHLSTFMTAQAPFTPKWGQKLVSWPPIFKNTYPLLPLWRNTNGSLAMLSSVFLIIVQYSYRGSLRFLSPLRHNSTDSDKYFSFSAKRANWQLPRRNWQSGTEQLQNNYHNYEVPQTPFTKVGRVSEGRKKIFL